MESDVKSYTQPEKGIIILDKKAVTTLDPALPDLSVFLDTSFLSNAKFKEHSTILVNSAKKISIKASKTKNYIIDADKISLNIMKKYAPIFPVIGAVTKLFDKISLKNIREVIMSKYDRTTLEAVEKGYAVVKLMR